MFLPTPPDSLRSCLSLICFKIPTRSSSTLCWIPADVSMNFTSQFVASRRPSETKKENFWLHVVAFIFKWANHGLFSSFSSFQHLTVNIFKIKYWQCLGLNRGWLKLETTALPTESQPLPNFNHAFIHFTVHRCNNKLVSVTVRQDNLVYSVKEKILGCWSNEISNRTQDVVCGNVLVDVWK